jgi:hypothetical protein
MSPESAITRWRNFSANRKFTKEIHAISQREGAFFLPISPIARSGVHTAPDSEEVLSLDKASRACSKAVGEMNSRAAGPSTLWSTEMGLAITASKLSPRHAGIHADGIKL